MNRSRLARGQTRQMRGMTLLELMLALTLTALVLVTISMAIDLHLRALQSRRSYVERIQLARAVLNVIASDLRATIQQNSTDFSSLASMASEALASGAAADYLEGTDTGGADSGGTGGGSTGGGSTGGGGTGGGSTGGGSTGGGSTGGGSSTSGDSTSDGSSDESGGTAQTENIASATTLPVVPGLYGNQYELQLDISRLPRVDEFQRMTAATPVSGLQDIPSDVKTVTYYCANANSGTSTGVRNRRTGQYESGLVRRVLDRAVTLYASQHANVQGLDQAAEVIAPEVASIEFQYFDGTQWLYQWDSEQQQGLPLAVKITLLLNPDPVADADTTSSRFTYGSAQVEPDQIYTLTVRLPTAGCSACETTTDSSGMEAVGL